MLPKYYPEGSSSRYRYYNYYDWFKSDGHSVITKPLLYNGYVKDLYSGQKALKRIVMLGVGIVQRMLYLLLNRKKFDLIIIEKELVTFMPFFIEKFFLKGTKFILDYDDNINARYQYGLSKLFLSNKILKMADIAGGITVGNHWYMDFYKEINKNKIYYVPTVINRELYQFDSLNKLQNNKLQIVWIGSLSTVKYLQLIDEVLVKLQNRYNFVLKVIGAKIPLKCNVEFIEWDSKTEIIELRRSDIGIMPLEDTDWERGKCGFKLIQYMASRLPVVASFSIANNEIINEESGFIARNDQDWIDQLSLLLESESLRDKMGENGKNRIYKDYSYQTWGPKFLEILDEVIKGDKL